MRLWPAFPRKIGQFRPDESGRILWEHAVEERWEEPAATVCLRMGVVRINCLSGRRRGLRLIVNAEDGPRREAKSLLGARAMEAWRPRKRTSLATRRPASVMLTCHGSGYACPSVSSKGRTTMPRWALIYGLTGYDCATLMAGCCSSHLLIAHR